MDVRCGRCGTEYEFDDALISERGTTVKCTNCGYQFKVFPPRSSQAVPERWVVRTGSGRELAYTSLRDLQRAIAQRQVGPEDLLSRGNQPPRALASIAELEPFFQMRSAVHVPRQPRTLHGVAPPANAPAPDTAPHARRSTPLGVGPQQPSSRIDALGTTLPTHDRDRDPPTIPRHLTPQPPRASQPRNAEPSAPPGTGTAAPHKPALNAGFAPAQAAAAPWQSAPASPLGVTELDEASGHAGDRAPAFTPTPGAVREAMASYEDIHADPRFLSVSPPRRARTRWIAGLILAGVVVLAGATVGRRYLAGFVQKRDQPQTAAVTDSRVTQMLEEAKRLLEEADFEGAKEKLDKASVLADKHPAVAAALARLETARADMHWLELRLLDPRDEPLIRSTHQRLGRRVGKAREAVDAALRIAPDDAGLLRARIDVLRLEDKLPDARALVGPVSQNPSQPDNAYTLAALDIAEATPGWSSIIDRLRSAAAGERGAGRARAALVYALARSGAIGDAQSEVEKLEAQAKGHPLLAELKSFVARHDVAADSGVAATDEVATVDVSKLPKLDTSAAAGDGDRAATAAAGSGDFRVKLQLASQALQRGELEQADQLYRAVLANQPNNTEAMSGIAEVARQRKDPETARRMNERVLEQNPSYLPALMSAADSRWDSGDRAGAVKLYRRVLEQAGPGTAYGQRAQARIAQAEKSSAGASEPSSEPAPAPQPPQDEKPHIDTTDLPGLNQ